MRDFRIRLLAVCIPSVIITLMAAPGGAVQIYGGWTRSDVGLQNEGDGFYAGVGKEIAWTSRVFDAAYALEFVQKVGSQPTFFSDPVTGFTVTDAQVTLYCLQPTILLGARIPDLGFVPRIYAGMSIVLKVKESWSDFPGQPSQEWGYKNSDIVGHLGASMGVGPVTVDFRYTYGFTGQLLDDNRVPVGTKSEVPPEGTFNPEVGAHIQNIQVGAGFTF